MYKILTQKNNKKVFANGEHLLKLISGDGEVAGYIVRIEAESRRTRHPGRNAWDIFFVFPTGENKIRTKKTFVTSDEIARYDGASIGAEMFECVETPLGQEVKTSPLRLEGKTLAETTPQEKTIIARAAMMAIQEGFGPHGEIKNSYELKNWAQGILNGEDSCQ